MLCSIDSQLRQVYLIGCGWKGWGSVRKGCLNSTGNEGLSAITASCLYHRKNQNERCGTTHTAGLWPVPTQLLRFNVSRLMFKTEVLDGFLWTGTFHARNSSFVAWQTCHTYQPPWSCRRHPGSGCWRSAVSTARAGMPCASSRVARTCGMFAWRKKKEFQYAGCPFPRSPRAPPTQVTSSCELKLSG